MRSAFRLTALTAIATMILLSGFARSTPAGTQAQDERSPFDALHFRGIGPVPLEAELLHLVGPVGHADDGLDVR